MGDRTSKSRKRSASSGASLDAPEFGRIVFFVDRSLGKKFVPEALRATGAQVEIHDTHFEPDAEDTEWLATAGARDWVVLSKDDMIRRRSHEVEALRQASVRAFLLTSAKLDGPRMAALFGKLALKMARLAINTPAPFVFAVNSAGKLTRIL